MRDIRKNPRNMYARVPQAMAQFVLKIEKLSHIMGPTPILEMARAYGLRPRLWLLVMLSFFLLENAHPCCAVSSQKEKSCCRLDNIYIVLNTTDISCLNTLSGNPTVTAKY